ncbi:hypothetical protein GY45DRAFT_1341067 [Cubamyces sp. BRFM 1775]|nr:hypothetical protein GY45DRAFT_1341067 [Cubamyces sp. BRFM 1775]
MSPQYTFKSTIPTKRSFDKPRMMSQEEDPRYRHLDRMLARAYIELQRQRQHRKNATIFMPRMDICDDPNSPVVTALFELPGMKAEQLSVRIENGKLIVDGERAGPHLHGIALSHAASEPTPSTATLYPVQEIKYGKFHRELALPTGVTAAHVRSTLAEGMLTVSWPRNPTPPSAHPTSDTSGHFYAAESAAAQTNTGRGGGEAAVA